MEHWKMVNSPGAGITDSALSLDPLATEGEATPGPDDVNPFEEEEDQAELAALLQTDSPSMTDDEIARQRDPTAGNDPFVFDDVEDEIDSLELPSLDDLGDGPVF